MLHDGAENGRLEMLPFARGFRDRNEIRPKKYAADAFDGNSAPASGETLASSALCHVARAVRQTGPPGRNFNVAGLGVDSV